MLRSLLCVLLIVSRGIADITKIPLLSTFSVTSPSVTPGISSPLPTNASVPPPIVTLKPASKAKYHMKLNGSGPAVLDSNLCFTATLIPDHDSHPDHLSVQFIYQWMNMADMSINKTIGELTSELTLTFSSEDEVQTGEHVITVAAFFKDNPSKMAAFQTMKFTLTEKLNGDLFMEQNLKYQRHPNVFSTKKEIALRANLEDVFQSHPHYSFIWVVGKQTLETKSPVFLTIIEKPSNFTIETIVIATFDEFSNDSAIVFKDEIINIIKHKDHISIPAPTNPLLKSGSFKEPVYFKDELQNCNIRRVDTDSLDKSVVLGQPLLINVTCQGSSPSSVCLTISVLNESLPDNETCVPVEFRNTLQHQVQVDLNNTGWSFAHFYVYNDVSRSHLVESFYAYNPDNTNVPGVVVPVLFGLVGLIVILVGSAYIMKLRKKPLVEVADFDFHPHLTSSMQSSGGSEASPALTRFTNKLRFLFSRIGSSTSRPKPREQKPGSSQDFFNSSTESCRYYDSL